MIGPRAGTRVWLAAGVTDMRCGMDTLAAKVQTALTEDPYSGHVFVFRGRRGDLVKLLWSDGDGMCLLAKRLERGRFVWPQAESGSLSLSSAQLSMLLEGTRSIGSTSCCPGLWHHSCKRRGTRQWPKLPEGLREPRTSTALCWRYSAVMSTTSTQKDLHAWQLYVELEDVRPKVWRRLLVPLTIELPRLHVMLLCGMGWDGGHVHEFIFGRDHYGATEPGREFPDDLMPEEDVTLTEALGTRKTFEYLYDFGDSWWHKIKVEQIVKLDSPIEYAQCVGGENACPPEDVGGSLGYEEFLEALVDPQHPEHVEMKEWIGRPFDPRAFDIDEVNARLNARE